MLGRSVGIFLDEALIVGGAFVGAIGLDLVVGRKGPRTCFAKEMLRIEFGALLVLIEPVGLFGRVVGGDEVGGAIGSELRGFDI